MKKWLWVLVGLLVLAGCGRDDYADYMAAVDKTENAESGKVVIDVVIENGFGEASDTETLLVKTVHRFENRGATSVSDIHYFGGELGMDSSFYRLPDGKAYLKLPYLPYYFEPEVPRETAEISGIAGPLRKAWYALLTADNVFSGKDEVLETDSGEVKAKVYAVKPTSEQLRTFKERVEEMLLTEEETVRSYVASFVTPETQVPDIQTVLSHLEIVGYEEKAYVNFDGYLVGEALEIHIRVASSEAFESLLTEQKIVVKTHYSELGQKQGLSFDAITEETIKPLEALAELYEEAFHD